MLFVPKMTTKVVLAGTFIVPEDFNEAAFKHALGNFAEFLRASGLADLKDTLSWGQCQQIVLIHKMYESYDFQCVELTIGREDLN